MAKATKKAAKKATKKATAKKAAPKATAKKAAPKAKKTSGKAKTNSAFMKALDLSPELAAVIGTKSAPRTEVVKGLWKYIKKHNLQDAKNRRNINTDDKLKAIFNKSSVGMFEMTKLIGKHLK